MYYTHSLIYKVSRWWNVTVFNPKCIISEWMQDVIVRAKFSNLSIKNLEFKKKGILTIFVTPFSTSKNLIKAPYKNLLWANCTKRIHTPSDLLIFNYLRKKDAKRNRSFIYFIFEAFCLYLSRNKLQVSAVLVIVATWAVQ